MGILLDSSTPIELLLKNALLKENLEFREQQRIYERGNDLQPKYVVDFVVVFRDVSVIVECDGQAYHSSDADVRRDTARDCWLKRRGHKAVLHFTTHQLRYEMRTVILTIKHHLGIINIPKKQRRFRRKRTKESFVINQEGVKMHRVTLYYAYIQVKDKVWVAYKFQDDTLERFSEERMKVFYNVPDKWGSALSIYVALCDLKRSVELLTYCSSEWLTTYLNGLLDSGQEAEVLLEKIQAELKKHNYLFKYINTRRDFTYYNRPAAERLIIHELQSRCRQLRYGKCMPPKQGEEIDFQIYLS